MSDNIDSQFIRARRTMQSIKDMAGKIGAGNTFTGHAFIDLYEDLVNGLEAHISRYGQMLYKLDLRIKRHIENKGEDDDD